MMRRRIVLPSASFIILWIGVPLLLMSASPDKALVVIRAASAGAMGWLLAACVVSAGALALLGWNRAAKSRRRSLITGLAILALIFCWVIFPSVWLNSYVVRQPPINIQAATPTATVWLGMAVVGSALAFVYCGQGFYALQETERQRQNLLLIVDSQLNEGIALFDRHLKPQWANTAGRRYLFDKRGLHPDIARLITRAHETGHVAAQSIVFNENVRLNVQAAPLADGSVSVIVRPLESDADQHQFYERFIRRIVHDMRNPLAAIIAHAGNLRASPGPDAAASQNTAQIIEQEAQRLTRLVDSMLFDARLSYVPPALESFDLVDVIEDVYFQHDERAIRENKIIEIEKPPEAAPIEADRDLLVRAVSNLVDNSLKYSKAGAVVHLSLETTPTNYILKVMDTGEGIPPEYLPDRIFDALVRARSTGSGSGLGLSIVKKIVELHRGSISGESVLGRGTTMTICLPR